MQGGNSLVFGIIALFFLVTDALDRQGVLWERPIVQFCQWLTEQTT